MPASCANSRSDSFLLRANVEARIPMQVEPFHLLDKVPRVFYSLSGWTTVLTTASWLQDTLDNPVVRCCCPYRQRIWHFVLANASSPAADAQKRGNDMAHEELELFVHGQGAKPRVIKASTGDVLRDVLIRFEVIKEGPDEFLVFIGECEEALAEPDETEDGVDKHAPADVNLTVEVLELKRHRHIHVHKCRHVAVEVNFNGKTKPQRSLRPQLSALSRVGRAKNFTWTLRPPRNMYCNSASAPTGRGLPRTWANSHSRRSAPSALISSKK